jgi:hypothetical protein
MNTYVMLIMLLHLDIEGYPFMTTLIENPRYEYATVQRCESASVTKREFMLKEAKNYPILGIVDVVIRCVDSEEFED